MRYLRLNRKKLAVLIYPFKIYFDYAFFIEIQQCIRLRNASLRRAEGRGVEEGGDGGCEIRRKSCW